MRLVIFIILFLNTLSSWAQHTIKGTVLNKEDSLPLPGVIVMVDSLNQTKTDSNGKFSILVDELPTSLTFSFVGMLTKTLTVDSDTNITVYLKPYVLVHYFDSQKIGLFINSGVLNNPIGGEVYFSSPYIFDQLLLKSSIIYQTDLEDNEFISGSLTLNNILRGRYFGFGLSTIYQEISFENELNIKALSVKSCLRHTYSPVDLFVGYSNLDITDNESSEKTYHGLILGISRYFHEPLKLTIATKVSIYNGLFGYQAKIHKSFNNIHAFARYYHLDSFSEFSLGIGFRITYVFSDPNKYELTSHNIMYEIRLLP